MKSWQVFLTVLVLGLASVSPAGAEYIVHYSSGGYDAPFVEGVNVHTTTSALQIIRVKNLERVKFYAGDEALTAALAAMDYPVPPGSLSTLNTVELGGDPHQVAAEKAYRKYRKLHYPRTVAVVRGDIPVDALPLIAYAKRNRIPVLLTEQDSVPAPTIDTLQRLKPSKILLVGGEEAVSEEVEQQLAQIAPVERVGGATRYETATMLASLVDEPRTIVVTDGTRPSEDTAFLAWVYRAPVVYVKPGEVPPATAEYLRNNSVAGSRAVRLVLAGVNASLIQELAGLIESPYLKGELVVRVRNGDDERLYVEAKAGLGYRGEYVNPGVTKEYTPLRLAPGRYTVRITWLDPDLLEMSSMEKEVRINPGRRTVLEVEIPRVTRDSSY